MTGRGDLFFVVRSFEEQTKDRAFGLGLGSVFDELRVDRARS